MTAALRSLWTRLTTRLTAGPAKLIEVGDEPVEISGWNTASHGSHDMTRHRCDIVEIRDRAGRIIALDATADWTTLADGIEYQVTYDRRPLRIHRRACPVLLTLVDRTEYTAWGDRDNSYQEVSRRRVKFVARRDRHG